MALDFDVEAELATDKLREVTEEGLRNVWYDESGNARFYDGAASHAVAILERLQAPTYLSPDLLRKLIASGRLLSQHRIETSLIVGVENIDAYLQSRIREGKRVFPHPEGVFELVWQDYLRRFGEPEIDPETGSFKRTWLSDTTLRKKIDYDHPQDRLVLSFDWKEYPGYPPIEYFHDFNPWFFGRPVKFFTGDHHIPIVYIPYSLERIERKIYVRCHMSKDDYMKAAYGDKTVEK